MRINPRIPEFSHRLDDETITLTPQGPLQDGTTYSVTVLPGIRDRDGNESTTPRTILFSVGGEQPITLSILRVTIVEDTIPAAGATYRLERLDTEAEFTYEWEADSSGLVAAEAIAYGRYAATAWREQVRPDGWQITEEPGARDTFELSLASRSHEKTYRIAVVDTTAPLIENVDASDPNRINVTFDDRLSPTAPLVPTMIRLWEAPRGMWDTEAAPDTLAADPLRGRRLDVVDVTRVGQDGLGIIPARPLRRDRLYRVEAVGVLNVDGLESAEEGGLGFRPSFEVPAVHRSGPIRWPEERP